MRVETIRAPGADPERTKQYVKEWVTDIPELPAGFSSDTERIGALRTIESVSERGLLVREREVATVPRRLAVAGHEFELNPEPIGSGGFGVVYEASVAVGEAPRVLRTRAARERASDAELDQAIQEAAAEEGAAPATIVLKFIIEGTSDLVSPEAIQKEVAAWSAHGGLVDFRRVKDETGTVVSVLALERAPGKSLWELKLGMSRNWETPQISSFELMAAMRSYLKQLISLTKRGWTSHNDIKPQNLMLARERGIARLIDLGLARRREDDERLQKQGSQIISGTLQYLSPLALTGRFDSTADTHALGLSIAEVWGTMRGIAESADDIAQGKGIESPALTEATYDAALREQFPKHMTFPSERDFGYLLYEMVLPHASIWTYRQTRERNPLPLKRALARTNEVLRDHIAFLTADAAVKELKRNSPAAESPRGALLHELEAAFQSEDHVAIRSLAARQEVKQLRRAARANR